MEHTQKEIFRDRLNWFRERMKKDKERKDFENSYIRSVEIISFAYTLDIINEKEYHVLFNMQLDYYLKLKKEKDF